MKKIGTVSYNIYCNFTNYGSALQTWALHQTIANLGYAPVLIDYCPDILIDKNPLNPYKNMWDKDDESRNMVARSMPAIKINYEKFNKFYRERLNITKIGYTSGNFNEVVKEGISNFICGSDTIFCIDEFDGFDDGYYANYDCMKGNSVAYAASFGDSHFSDSDYPVLSSKLKNFKAIGLRENQMIQYVEKNVDIPVKRTIDPTLLLTASSYDRIAGEKEIDSEYLLLYTRRYDPAMEEFAEMMAQENGYRIVEISLRATNEDKGHIMRYDAGVEEFISLIKYASFVITNSYHGMIFALHYHKPIVVFKREQADSKISELLELLDIKKIQYNSRYKKYYEIDYEIVDQKIEHLRNDSLGFLEMELGLL